MVTDMRETGKIICKMAKDVLCFLLGMYTRETGETASSMAKEF